MTSTPTERAASTVILRSTDDLLAERGKVHGEFKDHARVTQGLKLVMYNETRYGLLPAHHREALEMIVHKIGRVIAGDPNHRDHWDDIAGYARLVSQRIPAEPDAPQPRKEGTE
jgi:hypothetical protein